MGCRTRKVSSRRDGARAHRQRAENQLVWQYAGDDWWIGANDQTVEGAWTWVIDGNQFWNGAANGSPVGGLYSNWSSGQPNNLGNEDCAQLTSGGKWRDDACSDTERYVCEFAVDMCPSDPNKRIKGACGCGVADTDSDEDGTPNCIDQCPKDPTKVAPGDCGCTDAPKPAGTPCGDGLCVANQQCNGQGTCGNPGACPPPDSNCVSRALLGTHYWFCDNDRSFAQARQRCQSVGMDLVVVDSATEDQFLASNMHEDSWIGASDQAAEGSWVWTASGEPFWSGDENGSAHDGRYSNWSSGEPDDASATKDCAVKNDSAGNRWKAQSCGTTDAYICEESNKLRPLIPCVRSLGGGQLEAHFGYENRTGARKEITVGPHNAFAPPPIGKGQPEVFLPHRVDNAFAVAFDGSQIAWTLSGRTVMASSSSPVCPAPSCGTCGQALTCGGSTCVALCGDALCALAEDCETCPADCSCAQGQVCTPSGGCAVVARCGIEWECGAGTSFGVTVDCGACPSGQTCVAHACQ